MYFQLAKNMKVYMRVSNYLIYLYLLDEYSNFLSLDNSRFLSLSIDIVMAFLCSTVFHIHHTLRKMNGINIPILEFAAVDMAAVTAVTFKWIKGMLFS